MMSQIVIIDAHQRQHVGKEYRTCMYHQCTDNPELVVVGMIERLSDRKHWFSFSSQIWGC